MGLGQTKKCLSKRVSNFYKDNKERISERRKVLYNLQKTKPVVYLLPSENYIGTTENLKKRLARHKSYGRDVKNVRVLSEFDLRSDALELEEFLHELGYNGRHKYSSYK
jgi:predicted GIY-YIG superfamily endonuclease